MARVFKIEKDPAAGGYSAIVVSGASNDFMDNALGITAKPSPVQSQSPTIASPRIGGLDL